MPKRLSRKKPSKQQSDPNLSAFQAVQQLTRQTPKAKSTNVVPLERPKNAAAVALGRRGGLRSAAARIEKIDPAERRRIASHAARQRWSQKTKGDS